MRIQSCHQRQSIHRLLIGLICMSTIIFLIVGQLYASADELKIKEFVSAHEKLKEWSRHVQGKFWSYRIDQPLLDALSKSPEEIGIPLVSSGEFWRNGELFRVESISYVRSSDKDYQVLGATAEDSSLFYSYKCNKSLKDSLASLVIYDKDIVESRHVKSHLDGFYADLDALWGNSGVRYSDMLQRADMSIVITKNEPLKGGYSILGKNNQESTAQWRFRAGPYYLFGYAEYSDSAVNGYWKVIPKEVDGIVLPSRVINVMQWRNGTGSTSVVEFDIQPIQEESPLAKAINEYSFRNLGLAYNVYRYYKSEDGKTHYEMVRKVDPAKDPTQDSSLSKKKRSYMLVLSANIAVLLLIAMLWYVRRRRRS